MDKRDPRLRQTIAQLALALPGVFENVQWGGWAYKVPDKNGSTRKAKLLCHVVDGKNHGWHAMMKLPGRADAGRAHEVAEQYAWVEPHPWKTLGPSGWVVARPRDKRQLKIFAGLLAESRALLPEAAEPAPPESTRSENSSAPPTNTSAAASSNVARRMDAVMREAHAQGWQHDDPDAQAFAD